uniref:Uncharacterized protein n=1 Tax=Hemiselmis andersenii TaxID=464988 RepID=A0A7S1DL55_HEMAN|mmetsp:Transcript_19248/g.46259  ORF Transcript_19248/g.46259 Transcript_19248/m.46259 type:complete len:229 (+) Transcript_19248:58-744(+)
MQKLSLPLTLALCVLTLSPACSMGIIPRTASASLPIRVLRGDGLIPSLCPSLRLNGGGMLSTGLTKLQAAVGGGGGGKAQLLEGKWRKESEVGQDEAMQQLGLNLVFRKAANLLSKLEIRTSPNLQIITKGALIVQIKEKYEYDGSPAKNARRDKRWGSHNGKVVSVSDRKVVLDIRWGEPHGGQLLETFEVDKKGRLVQTSEIKVNEDARNKKPGTWFTYKSVFRRE